MWLNILLMTSDLNHANVLIGVGGARRCLVFPRILSPYLAFYSGRFNQDILACKIQKKCFTQPTLVVVFGWFVRRKIFESNSGSFEQDANTQPTVPQLP